MASTLEKASRAEIERRRRKAEMLRKTREQRTAHVAPLELRESDDGTTITLVGIACRTGVEYQIGRSQREIILPEAFKRTLSEDPDVQLVVNHAAGGQLPLARTRSGTMRLALVDEGLQVEADLDAEDPDVQSLVRKMRRGDVDGMSFAFMVTEGGDSWDETYSLRTIRNLSLHRGDVSVVNQGANPLAYATVRSAEAATHLAARSQSEIYDALYELRIGKALSAANVEILTDALNLAHDAETAAGDARTLLDGLVNPTEDSAESEDSVERSINGEKGLCAAIRAVIREPGQDEWRREIVKRAHDLGFPGLIPDVWAEDGTLDEARALPTAELRETYNDTYTALQGALQEKLDGDYWYCWIQDFTDTEVIYYAGGGDLWSAPYTLVPSGPVTIGDPVKVRPVTEYVPAGDDERAAPALEIRSGPDIDTLAMEEFEYLRLRGAR